MFIIYCRKCGTENDDNAKFCKGCGAILNQSPKVENNNAQSSNNKLIIAIAVIICVCVIAGGLFLVYGDNLGDGVDTSSNDIADDSSDSVNEDISESSSSHNIGIDFSEAANYFPEASETVLAHVFDEADTDVDGYLSDSELDLFKKVRDHTKKYANNIKNDYSTVKPSSSDETGYCADHGRVAVVDGNKCPYCIDLGYSDTRTKTSSW